MNADERLGICRGPTDRKDWEIGREPVSLCELTAEAARAFGAFLNATAAQPFDSVSRTIMFLWCIQPDETIKVAAEEVATIGAQAVPPGYAVRRGLGPGITNECKLGHPCLVRGEARAAGELYIDDSAGERVWMLNFKSGRFHSGVNAPPNLMQAKNIGQIFADLLECPVELDLDDDFPVV